MPSKKDLAIDMVETLATLAKSVGAGTGAKAPYLAAKSKLKSYITTLLFALDGYAKDLKAAKDKADVLDLETERLNQGWKESNDKVLDLTLQLNAAKSDLDLEVSCKNLWKKDCDMWSGKYAALKADYEKEKKLHDALRVGIGKALCGTAVPWSDEKILSEIKWIQDRRVEAQHNHNALLVVTSDQGALIAKLQKEKEELALKLVNVQDENEGLKNEYVKLKAEAIRQFG